MLAYRHAFHAGNHGDVLKHATLVHLVDHLNLKDKGYRVVDTHAGAGAYALGARQARLNREHDGGIQRLWRAEGLPPLLQRYVERVRDFNTGPSLRQYPGSPELVRQLMRPQDQLRLFELHATDHGLLSGRMRGDPRVELRPADGFLQMKSQLPPPTRRGLVLIDPSYEIKTDYTRTLTAVREVLSRFAECVVLVWVPQLQRLDAARLPQRLKTAAAGVAPKGWLLARLTVQPAADGGFGMLGSAVFVANPPHTLAPALREALPWLATHLADDGRGRWSCEGEG